jgi:hypothetical protein
MKRLYLFLGAAALVAASLTASPALNAQENGNRDENGKSSVALMKPTGSVTTGSSVSEVESIFSGTRVKVTPMSR